MSYTGIGSSRSRERFHTWPCAKGELPPTAVWGSPVAPRWPPWIDFNGGVQHSWRAGRQAESGVIGTDVVEPNK